MKRKAAIPCIRPTPIKGMQQAPQSAAALCSILDQQDWPGTATYDAASAPWASSSRPAPFDEIAGSNW